MDIPRKYAKSKKPNAKDHIMYDSMYMKYPEQVYPETERRLLRARRREGWGAAA